MEMLRLGHERKYSEAGSCVNFDSLSTQRIMMALVSKRVMGPVIEQTVQNSRVINIRNLIIESAVERIYWLI